MAGQSPTEKINCIRCRHDARCDGRCAQTRVGHDPGCPKAGTDDSGIGGEGAYWERVK